MTNSFDPKGKKRSSVARDPLERVVGSLPASRVIPRQSVRPDCRLAARQHAEDSLQTCPALSDRARHDMLTLPGEPFWLCDWTDVVFLHFEVDAATLQREVPFALDLFAVRAFVSLVAFTLTDMRPRWGGRLSRLLFKPFGTNRFLNVRTYVRHREHAGIYFLAEWLDAPRLNLLAGPALYGLPFHCGRLNYQNHPDAGRVSGTVHGRAGALAYSGTIDDPPQLAARDSLDEFLVERYRAFTCRGDRQGWFPVSHEPWQISVLLAQLTETSLLNQSGHWLRAAHFHSAHWSPGAGGVWMGRWRNGI